MIKHWSQFPLEEINKASLKFELDHKRGSLATILNVMSDCKLNLTKIQSLPKIDTPQKYAFFVDVTFDAYTDVTTNSTGHVTGHEVTTFTLPANPNVNTTSLPVKNSGGTTQFTSTQTTGVRFAGSGATSVAFTPGTQLVTISSTNSNETYTLPVAAGGANSAVLNLTAGGTGSGIKSL